MMVQIRSAMQRIAAKPVARTAARTGLTLLTGAAYLFGPHLLNLTSENFNPGLVDSLAVGAAVGFGKLNRQVGAVSLLGLFLFGPIAACTVFPLTALSARIFGKKPAPAEQRINQVV